MEATIGHNSEAEPTAKFARDQLKSIIERIEQLNDAKEIITEDIRDVYTEAKGNSFDVTAIRKIVAMRKQDQAKREEAEAILATYMIALGMAV